jgi:hypothetical protein
MVSSFASSPLLFPYCNVKNETADFGMKSAVQTSGSWLLHFEQYKVNGERIFSNKLPARLTFNIDICL